MNRRRVGWLVTSCTLFALACGGEVAPEAIAPSSPPSTLAAPSITTTTETPPRTTTAPAPSEGVLGQLGSGSLGMEPIGGGGITDFDCRRDGCRAGLGLRCVTETTPEAPAGSCVLAPGAAPLGHEGTGAGGGPPTSGEPGLAGHSAD